MAWLNGYKYRSQILISGTALSTMPTEWRDVNIMVQLASYTMRLESAGDDIVFTADDGTTLRKWEREIIDVGTPTNGEYIVNATFWVTVAVHPSATNSFYMYWGKSGETDQQSPGDVWTGYDLVWHVKPDGTAPDSTTNLRNADLTYFGQHPVSGQIGTAIEYPNSSGSWIWIGSGYNTLTPSYVQLECWLWLGSYPWGTGDERIIVNAPGSNPFAWRLSLTSGSSNVLTFSYGESANVHHWYGPSLTNDCWHKIAVTYDNNDVHCEVDATSGSMFGDGSGITNTLPTPDYLISVLNGYSSGLPDSYGMRIDELRIRSSAFKLAGENQFEYFNQSGQAVTIQTAEDYYARQMCGDINFSVGCTNIVALWWTTEATDCYLQRDTDSSFSNPVEFHVVPSQSICNYTDDQRVWGETYYYRVRGDNVMTPYLLLGENNAICVTANGTSVYYTAGTPNTPSENGYITNNIGSPLASDNGYNLSPTSSNSGDFTQWCDAITAGNEITVYDTGAMASITYIVQENAHYNNGSLIWYRVNSMPVVNPNIWTALATVTITDECPTDDLLVTDGGVRNGVYTLATAPSNYEYGNGAPITFDPLKPYWAKDNCFIGFFNNNWGLQVVEQNNRIDLYTYAMSSNCQPPSGYYSQNGYVATVAWYVPEVSISSTESSSFSSAFSSAFSSVSSEVSSSTVSSTESSSSTVSSTVSSEVSSSVVSSSSEVSSSLVSSDSSVSSQTSSSEASSSVTPIITPVLQESHWYDILSDVKNHIHTTCNITSFVGLKPDECVLPSDMVYAIITPSDHSTINNEPGLILDGSVRVTLWQQNAIDVAQEAVFLASDILFAAECVMVALNLHSAEHLIEPMRVRGATSLRQDGTWSTMSIIVNTRWYLT